MATVKINCHQLLNKYDFEDEGKKRAIHFKRRKKITSVCSRDTVLKAVCSGCTALKVLSFPFEILIRPLNGLEFLTK